MLFRIKVVFSIVLTISLTGCLRLDENLFNQAKLKEYKLDNYTGETDFILDYSYHIPDSLVHIFTISSQAPDESKPTTIYAIYIGNINKINKDTVILYCHGNKDHMDFYWQRAKLLANTGHKNQFGVLMIDYRGFGLSDGKPTENGIYADVDAAIKWLRDKGLSSERLIMYGFSLGSAPATKLTAEPRILTPEKLLLEAPFANAETMVQDASALSMPASFFTDLKINNAVEIRTIQQPFFWIHGEADDFLNITSHGQVVFDNYSGSYKESHKIPNAGHSTIPATFGFSNYTNAINTFITTH
jgi:pimeloyl-ACP methyl ester carboxylesterase